MSDSKPPSQDETESRPKMSLWETVSSVFALFFGVQSQKNRERDFSRGKASHFIIVAVVMTALLVLTLVTVVQLVKRQAGI